MTGHRVVFPVIVNIKAADLPKNGHSILRQQSRSQRLSGTEAAFWGEEGLLLSVGDGTYATVADADINVTLHTEDPGPSARPPRWLPLLSCVRAPSLSSKLHEPKAGGQLQVVVRIGQQAHGPMRLSLQQTHGRLCFTDHDRQPVFKVHSMEDRGGPRILHTPGTPLTPLKESAPAPSHDLTTPDSPSTSIQERSAFQFELRQAKSEEPVAQCTWTDDVCEIELLEDGRSKLWGCVHLPLPRSGQALGDVFGEVHLDLMQQTSGQDVRVVRCPADRLPLDAGERVLPQPLVWCLLPLARPPSLIPSVSRSPFIARLRLPRFCSGFERHAFAPCDPQTLSFSAGSSYVIEPQLQLQCSPEPLQPGQVSGQTTRISLWPFLKSSAEASKASLLSSAGDVLSAPDAIRAEPSAIWHGVGEMRRSSRSMRRTDSMAYEPQPCELALDIAPQQASEAPAVACLAFLFHAHAKRCQQLINNQLVPC
ncbi:hypothetical protein WJX74_007565 [Apatococcus lobatus]|uniref:Anaphase-promoting complex subunit 1 n=1 Tax=Apatococcus lobatus TaxID=904363 RepID=A0AAW1RM88_9CHLO